MAEIELKKRVVYAGDVHIALLKSGWSIREACDFVNGLPKADVAEVRHGRWEQCFEDWRRQIEGDKCSACGFEHYGCSIAHYHYCPNCGARMDGGADDGTKNMAREWRGQNAGERY